MLYILALIVHIFGKHTPDVFGNNDSSKCMVCGKEIETTNKKGEKQ